MILAILAQPCSGCVWSIYLPAFAVPNKAEKLRIRRGTTGQDKVALKGWGTLILTKRSSVSFHTEPGLREPHDTAHVTSVSYWIRVPDPPYQAFYGTRTQSPE